MLEKIKIIDTQLFLYLNRLHNSFFDVIMYWASDKLFWIPFYLFIVLVIIKYYKKQSILIFIFIALLITLADQTASHLLKNSVQRLRPSHEPTLQGLVHLSKAGPGGLYGFISGHAANSFALMSFLFFVLQKKLNWLKWILFFWAILVSYSRIYNGVHYPTDVLVAMFFGVFLGYVLSKFYWYLEQHYSFKKKLYKNE